jgi:formylglycine-generating enzyme required for sulfatase activity
MLKPAIFILAALACSGSSAWPQSPAAGKRAKPRRAKSGIEWVTIPGGTFMMGSDDWPNSKPRHRVSIMSFQLSKTLVTAGQYKKCVKAGACRKPPCDAPGDKYPVVCVNWNDAQAFAKWAGARLPSEAEWEYAARGGGLDRKYPWGDEEPNCELAVFSSDRGDGCGKGSAWPVCSKPKGNTPQGLCDMAGNVWEWLQDWYHDSYNGAPADGGAWVLPAGSNRVVRGGSWHHGAGVLRTSRRRNGVGPDYRGDGHGIRLARSRP